MLWIYGAISLSSYPIIVHQLKIEICYKSRLLQISCIVARTRFHWSVSGLANRIDFGGSRSKVSEKNLFQMIFNLLRGKCANDMHLVNQSREKHKPSPWKNPERITKYSARLLAYCTSVAYGSKNEVSVEFFWFWPFRLVFVETGSKLGGGKVYLWWFLRGCLATG